MLLHRMNNVQSAQTDDSWTQKYQDKGRFLRVKYRVEAGSYTGNRHLWRLKVIYGGYLW